MAFGASLGGAEAAGAANPAPGRWPLTPDPRRRDVGQLVVEAPVAERGRERRARLQRALPVLVAQLRERGIANRLVIQRSALDFDAPVEGDFTATSALPARAEWERFLATLARHRSARVTVSSTVESASSVGGRHEGTYVAVRI